MDEVEVEIANMTVKLLSTRPNVRRDLAVKEHLTALLTNNGKGEQAPPLLLFPGEDTCAIPSDLMRRDDVWTDFTVNAYMDVKTFTSALINFCEFISVQT